MNYFDEFVYLCVILGTDKLQVTYGSAGSDLGTQ